MIYPLGVHVVDAFEELIGMVTLNSVLAPSPSPVCAQQVLCKAICLPWLGLHYRRLPSAAPCWLVPFIYQYILEMRCSLHLAVRTNGWTDSSSPSDFVRTPVPGTQAVPSFHDGDVALRENK